MPLGRESQKRREKERKGKLRFERKEGGETIPKL